MNINNIIIQVIVGFNQKYKLLFVKYNKLYFDNKLKMPKFKYLSSDYVNTKLTNGFFNAKKRLIGVSVEDDKNNEILLHEMCHMAQVELDNDTQATTGTYFGHTKTWQKWMKKCNQKIDEIYRVSRMEYGDADYGEVVFVDYNKKWHKAIVVDFIDYPKITLALCYIPNLNILLEVDVVFDRTKGIIPIDNPVLTNLKYASKKYEKNIQKLFSILGNKRVESATIKGKSFGPKNRNPLIFIDFGNPKATKLK